jgi:hypothetical protein
MAINHQTELRILFEWRDKAKSRTRPSPTSLSSLLSGKFLKTKGEHSSQLKPEEASLFASAAVDMWGRAVHSFLVSAATTDVSPIWSAVSAYYSSHYSLRALGHSLGYFRLFKVGCVAEIELHGGSALCSFSKKSKAREHNYYATAVQSAPFFATDPLFSTVRVTPGWLTEVAGRDFANYADHLFSNPNFVPLDEEQLQRRIRAISAFDMAVPPTPPAENSLNVDTVQILAYLRLARLRQHLDAFVTTNSTYWNTYRSPSWATQFMSFQAGPSRDLSSGRGLLGEEPT